MSVAVLDDPADEFARDLAKVISAVMTIRGVRPAEMWVALGVSRATWYNRMRDGEFTALQMSRMAALLEVPVEVLFGGPGELLRVQNAK